MTEQEARATIKRISNAAIELAICRHSLVKDDADEDGVISDEEVEHIKKLIGESFRFRDLGPLHHYLGVRTIQGKDHSISLVQDHYVQKLTSSIRHGRLQSRCHTDDYNTITQIRWRTRLQNS